MARMRFEPHKDAIKTNNVFTIKEHRFVKKAKKYKIATIILALISIGEAIYIGLHYVSK